MHVPETFARALFRSLAALLLASGLRAQETTVEELQQRIASTQESQELDEATRAKVIEDLRAAVGHLERIPALQEAGNASRKLVEEGQATVTRLRDELEKLPKEAAPPEQIRRELQLTVESPVRIVEAAWRTVVAALNELKNQRETKLAAIRNEELRPTKIEQEELPLVRSRLDEIAKALAEVQPPEVSQPRWAARRELLLARQRARLAEQLALQQELLASPLKLEILKAERDLLHRKVTLEEARERYLQELLRTRRQEDEAEERRKAEEAVRQTVGKHSLVKKLAEENRELAEEKGKTQQKLEGAVAAGKRWLEKAAELEKAYESTVALLEIAESGLAMANVLRQRRQEYLVAVEGLLTEKEIQARVTEAWVRRAQLNEQREALDDLEQQRMRLLQQANLAELGAQNMVDLAQKTIELHESLKEQLRIKQGHLKDLETIYAQYTASLVPLGAALRRLQEAQAPLGRLIDEGLMWMPSSEPLGLDSLPAVGETAGRLLGALHPERLWEEIAGLPPERQVLIVGALLYSLIVLLTSRLWRERTAVVNRKLGRVHEDSFWFTTNTLIVTALRAGVWAVPCWALTALPTIGPGLAALAPFLYFLHVLWLMVHPTGMGVAHFRWDKAAVGDVRCNLRWLAPLLCLATFVAGELERTASIEETHGLGRVFVVLGLIGLSTLFARLFRRRGPLVAHLEKRAGQTWLYRLRRLWWVLAVVGPLALGVAASLGYYYTTLRLAQPMTRSIQLALGVFLVQELVFRYLSIAQRRLALARAIEKREAALAKGEDPEDLPQVESPEFDLSAINQQTHHLIRTFTGLGLILVLWWAWKGVFPAFTVFDDVYLIQGYVSLADLGLVALIAIGTVAAARNLPGVLEILVLKHLPLDSGGRYATTTISRYLITATGLVLAFETLGVGWSDVQWLVAALGVGLGFGLQEIFANFVSGLIIFFERRIRVGDVVTVDGVDGIVSKIRILGTTITNWDRKEYIVPNKEFVTGRLLNWTLSDTINRLVVSVGIAYGSDVQKALDLLHEAAREHPIVLKDPPPFATFEVFGDSSLSLNLRCFLPDLSGRLRTLTEINQAIDRKFRDAGIEIAFPQRDLHVRSIELPPHLLRAPEED